MRREDWDRKYGEKEQLWSREPNRHVVEEAQALAPGRALDLACGEGRHAVWLAKLGWRVTAVDFSEVAIEKGRVRAAREKIEIDFRTADLLDFEPEPGAFDLVLVLFLQLPPDERQLVLARAEGALAPDGTFLLIGHDLANLAEGVGGPSDPSVLYTPEDIVAELPELEVEKAERVLREVSNVDRPAIDALVRARRFFLDA
ncbi:MAG: class I SAM-dependent methyltransferase [Actinobacteria bacterium]|nr:class I SAM-dependent methyltransferase [Actinomycetota bacterium]